MRKFVKKLLLFFFLLISILVLLVFSIPPNPQGFNQAYSLKEQLMETVPSPRLILVGGSNVAFGFDSKMLEDSLGIKVVNDGLHAGIGLKFMMDDLFSGVRPNDIILISPEYNQFFGNLAYGGLPLAEVITTIVPNKISLLNLSQFIAVVSNVPGNVKSRLQYHFNFVLNKKNPLSDAIYSLSSFNSYGDMCRHWELPTVSYEQLSYIKDTFNKTMAKRFVRQINILKSMGCQVFLYPPAISYSSFYNMEDNIKEIFNFCQQSNTPFMLSAQQCALADTLCFDTPYHLTYTGTILRTKVLIKDLKKYMNK